VRHHRLYALDIVGVDCLLELPDGVERIDLDLELRPTRKSIEAGDLELSVRISRYRPSQGPWLDPEPANSSATARPLGVRRHNHQELEGIISPRRERSESGHLGRDSAMSAVSAQKS
jgi:hypothetical protein